MIEYLSDNRAITTILELELFRQQEAEAESQLTAAVLKALCGGIWHTTTAERYKGILSKGAILPEPGIPDSERWGAGLGTIGCPYVRSIGGVSLFDFRDFDSDEYSGQYPLSSWREFVPYRSACGEAIWIELNLAQMSSGFISGREILHRWKAEQATSRFMPLIEAAYIGPLPVEAFKQVLQVSKESLSVRRVQ